MRDINKCKVRLFALKSLLRNDIEQMREFNNVSEGFLKRELKHFVSRIEKEAEGMPDDKKEHHYGWHADTYLQISVTFPKIQRASLFLATISLLETRLNKICDFLSYTKPQNAVTLSDLKDKGIDRAMLFIKKIGGISLDSNTKTWESIKIYQKIRSHIIHADDLPIKDTGDIKAIKKYSQIEGGVKLDEKNRIEIENTFLVQVLNVVERFLNQIIAAIEQNRAQMGER